MASTYPLEVVEAARWSQANSGMTGQALEDAMQKQSWDPSVKALTAVPQTLQMMNDKLEWTRELGDAFLAQQSDVLDAVQRLRQRADNAGNLKTTQQQRVVKVDNSAYVVSYGDLPLYAFVASYVDDIHEKVYYCPASGWFFNEPHSTKYDIVGRYKLGPDPSSTLPRVAVTVLGGDVWVDPAQPVAGLVPGADATPQQYPAGPFCQDPRDAL